METSADVVAVCITCCTVTGLVFGLAGVILGRVWSKSAYEMKVPRDESNDVEEAPLLTLQKPLISNASMRHRPTLDPLREKPSFI